MVVDASLNDPIGRLVHPVAHGSPLESARHRMFIATRLGVFLATLAMVPLYLASGGIPGWTDALVLAWLAVPFLAVAHVSATGRLINGEIMSLVAWIGLAFTLFLGHGCSIGPAIALILLISLETSFSNTPRMTSAGTVAVLMAAAILLAIFVTGWVHPTGFKASDAVFYALATLYAVGLAYCGRVCEAIRKESDGVDAQRYRVLSEAVGDLVLRYDRSGDVLVASRASERLFGIKPQDLMGRGFFERVHIADRPAFLKMIGDAANGSESVTATLRFRFSSVSSEDGPYEEPVYAWIEMRSRQIDFDVLARNGEPRGAGVIAVVRDVTTRMLHEVEIERARQDAEQANAWKDRFLATVSHELRTPLNAIIGFGEMLASDTLAPRDPAKRREYAEIIHTSGHHLLAVVNSLLDMSKIDAGKFDFVPEPFDVAALVDACCDMVGLKAEQAQIVLTRDLHPSLDEVVGDKRACKQIIINLLSNALKFTPEKGRVLVSVKPEGNSISIAVSDTGIGIMPRDLSRIGDPFFQARNTYDRPYEGTGLGLSVVRGLVGLHGGTITLDSAPGDGTRIAVRLPLDCRRGQQSLGQKAKIEVVTRYPRSSAPVPLLEPLKAQKIA